MNKNKTKGTAFETDVVNYLKPWFPRIERRALAGKQDKGDIAGIEEWILECKNQRSITLADFMKEVAAEKANADVPYGAAVIKARGKNVSQSYVVMTLEDWARWFQ